MRPFLFALAALAACAGPPESANLSSARLAPARADACASVSEPNRQGIAFADSVHALVVFVRFADDALPSREWPAEIDGEPTPLTWLPPFARDLVVPDPAAIRDGAMTPEDSSLSAFFY